MTPPEHTVPIETLLLHQNWVRSVARTLVWSGEDPEDLEQRAWLAAAENPPRDERLGRSWLGTVLKRAAARVVRTDSRRRAREEASARTEPSPSASDLVATAELQEKLVRKVLALAEPYREAILLRFYEGLSVRQIAKRTTAPIETIRSRLRRGLRQLRADFKASERENWRLLLMPLAGAPALKAGSAVALGVLLFVLAASVTVWFMPNVRSWPAEKDDSTTNLMQPSAAPQDPTPELARVPFIDRDDPASDTGPATRPALRPVPPGSGRLELQILRHGGAPAVGRAFDLIVNSGVKTEREIVDEEEVLAHTWGDLENDRLAEAGVRLVEAVSDRDGLVVCDVRAGLPGRLRVCATPVGWRQVKVREEIEWLGRVSFEAVSDGETRRLPPLTLPFAPLLVAGRVESQSGEPMAGIIVHALLTGADAAKPELTDIAHRWIARTDEAGRFRIEASVPSTAFLLWAHRWDKHWKSISPLIPLEAGESDLVIRAVGDGSVKGRVRSATGLEGLSLALAPEGVPSFYLGWPDGLPIPLEIGEDGGFASGAVVAGTYTLEVMVGVALVRSIPGVVIEAGKLNADPRFADLLVGEELRPILITVVDEERRPVHRARVFVRSTAIDGPVRYSMTWFTDGRGEMSMLLPEGTPIAVTVAKPGYLPSEIADGSFPLRVTLVRGATVVIQLPGSRNLPFVDGVHRYWLCLVSEAAVATADREKRGPIPRELPRSQARELQENQTLTFEGVRPDRYVVFLFPERTSLHTGSGDCEELGGGDALELGRIEVGRNDTNAASLRVDVDRLMALINR